MSYSYDFLIDAAVTRDELSTFLSHICEWAIRERDQDGSPIHECGDLLCYLRQPATTQQARYERNLRFAPTWRVECHLQAGPFRVAGLPDRPTDRDPQFRMADMMRLLVHHYGCNLAWLDQGSCPILLKRDRLVLIQGQPFDRDTWTQYLSHIVRSMGYPYDVGHMPAF